MRANPQTHKRAHTSRPTNPAPPRPRPAAIKAHIVEALDQLYVTGWAGNMFNAEQAARNLLELASGATLGELAQLAPPPTLLPPCSRLGPLGSQGSLELYRDCCSAGAGQAGRSLGELARGATVAHSAPFVFMSLCSPSGQLPLIVEIGFIEWLWPRGDPTPG